MVLNPDPAVQAYWDTWDRMWDEHVRDIPDGYLDTINEPVDKAHSPRRSPVSECGYERLRSSMPNRGTKIATLDSMRIRAQNISVRLSRPALSSPTLASQLRSRSRGIGLDGAGRSPLGIVHQPTKLAQDPSAPFPSCRNGGDALVDERPDSERAGRDGLGARRIEA
jgi:hypothetical protein